MHLPARRHGYRPAIRKGAARKERFPYLSDVKRKIIFILFAVLTALWVAGSLPGETGNLRIRLRWIPSHTKETWSDARTGLAWSLSFLGAMLPRGRLDSAFVGADYAVLQ